MFCLHLFRACILRRLCALIVEADPSDLWLLGVLTGISVESDDDTVKNCCLVGPFVVEGARNRLSRD